MKFYFYYSKKHALAMYIQSRKLFLAHHGEVLLDCRAFSIVEALILFQVFKTILKNHKKLNINYV